MMGFTDIGLSLAELMSSLETYSKRRSSMVCGRLHRV